MRDSQYAVGNRQYEKDAISGWQLAIGEEQAPCVISAAMVELL
jgi:hypothetical protein